MPTPTPPPRGPESPLAALRLAYPTWRFVELPDGRWLAAVAPLDVPVNQLTADRFGAVRAKTLVGLAAAVREAHANRWQAQTADVA